MASSTENFIGQRRLRNHPPITSEILLDPLPLSLSDNYQFSRLLLGYPSTSTSHGHHTRMEPLKTALSDRMTAMKCRCSLLAASKSSILVNMILFLNLKVAKLPSSSLPHMADADVYRGAHLVRVRECRGEGRVHCCHQNALPANKVYASFNIVVGILRRNDPSRPHETYVQF